MTDTPEEVQAPESYIRTFISPQMVQRILYRLQEIIVFIINPNGNPILTDEERTKYRGGFICLSEITSGLPELSLMIGEVPITRIGKYSSLVIEKSIRVAQNHLISSWQNRSPEDRKYGGAILANDMIFSFSGFPELIDEAIVTVLAFELGQIDISMVHRIVNISTNPYTFRIIETLQATKVKGVPRGRKSALGMSILSLF